MSIKLTPRLKAAADFVRSNKKIADIGTDHGYLVCYLVQNGICKSGIASDIGEGPLMSAKQTITENNLTSLVVPRLSDGLKQINKDEADDIVIAGMGGELIALILSECSWAKDKDKHFVFQPMTHPEFLRSYLCNNGYKINKETVVGEGNKNYCIMDVSFSGEIKKYSLIYKYIGEIKTFDELPTKNYINHLINYLINKQKGNNSGELQAIIEELKLL